MTETLDIHEKESLESVDLDALALEGGAGLISREVVEKIRAEQPPSPEDPRWESYVLSLLTESEKDKEGYPRCHGLRRLVKNLLGQILKSKPKQVHPPYYEGGDVCKAIRPAVVEWELVVKTADGSQLEFGEVGEANSQNNQGKFSSFHVAIAATRAEARTYRKSLGLSMAAADEKMFSEPVPIGNQGGFISDSQSTTIEIICQRLGIDVMKFINSSKSVYEKLSDVSGDKAELMIEYLNKFQTREIPTPDSIRSK